MEPEPFKEGIRINSPDYLVKLIDDEPGSKFSKKVEFLNDIIYFCMDLVFDSNTEIGKNCSEKGKND